MHVQQRGGIYIYKEIGDICSQEKKLEKLSNTVYRCKLEIKPRISTTIYAVDKYAFSKETLLFCISKNLGT